MRDIWYSQFTCDWQGCNGEKPNDIWHKEGREETNYLIVDRVTAWRELNWDEYLFERVDTNSFNAEHKG